MPGPLIAFWILIGFGGAAALWGPPRAWDGVDPTAQSCFGKPERGFYSWLSAAPYQVAQKDSPCRATAFGVSLGQRHVRAQFDGQEQNVDWSWSYDVTAGLAEVRHVTVRYLDPLGGAELACHDLHFTCVPENWDGQVRSTITFSPCPGR